MNPYQILGVPENATKEEIKRAYRELVKRYHPDVGGSDEIFKVIREAYEKLIGEERILRPKKIHTIYISLEEQAFGGFLRLGSKIIKIPLGLKEDQCFYVEDIGTIRFKFSKHPFFKPYNEYDLLYEETVTYKIDRPESHSIPLLNKIFFKKIRLVPKFGINYDYEVRNVEENTYYIKIPNEGLSKPDGSRGDLYAIIKLEPIIKNSIISTIKVIKNILEGK
jgi:curved DNA-binding protein CbpA